MTPVRYKPIAPRAQRRAHQYDTDGHPRRWQFVTHDADAERDGTQGCALQGPGDQHHGEDVE